MRIVPFILIVLICFCCTKRQMMFVHTKDPTRFNKIEGMKIDSIIKVDSTTYLIIYK